jgi:ribosomal protein S18 acetylase RimI-like enzyme
VSENPLDNPVWFALTGPHSGFASGGGLARHYRREIAPYSAIADASPRAVEDLDIELPPQGEVRMFRSAKEPPPRGWQVLSAHPILQMEIKYADLPRRFLAEHRITALDVSHVDGMLELVRIARPGPFYPKTPLMGSYVGIRDNESQRLVGMIGERLLLNGFVELSALAVLPSARGSGLGAALLASHTRAAFERGLQPFLHVYEDNPAVPLYRSLGYRDRAVLWVLLWARDGGAKSSVAASQVAI